MTTYSTIGISIQFNEVTGLASSFASGTTLKVAMPTGSSTFTYSVLMSDPGELDDVTLNSNAFTVLVDDVDVETYNGGAGADNSFGAITWNDGGTTRVSYVVIFENNTPDLESIFVIGGDPLPNFADLTAFNNFLQNDLISLGSAGMGSGFEPGDTISLAAIPGVGVTEDDIIFGTPGDDNINSGAGNDTIDGGLGNDTIDPGENDNGFDLINGSQGNDTITFANQVGNNDYNELNYSNAIGALTVTLNGVTDTGTVDKGGVGIDTILGVTNVFNAGWFTGGLGLYGSAFDDTFDITTGTDQWLQVGGGAGNDTFNITKTGNGLVRIDYSRAAGSINVDLSTGTVSNDGDGGMDTITGDVWEIRGSNFTDTILGSGNDESFIGRTGNDNIDGGGGFDRIRYDRGGVDSGVNADLAAGNITGSWFGNGFTHTVTNIEWVRGSIFDDVFTGSNASERFDTKGNNGFDLFNGSNGDDIINFADHTDNNDYTELNYSGLGAGIDVVIDGETNIGSIDKGVNGTDTIWDVANPLNTGWFNGGLATYGTNFNDTFDITTGNEQWNQVGGGAGNDTFNITKNGTGLTRIDYSRASSGIDLNLATGVVSDDGDGGMDTINGYVREIRGSNSTDIMVGSNNDESFIGRSGNDDIDGGGGFDRIRYDRSGLDNGINADLGGGTITGSWFGNAFTHTVSNIEWLRGSNFDDTINGSAGNDQLDGKNGNDTINGLAGDDIINGEDGNDILNGGDGNDRIAGGAGDDTINPGDNIGGLTGFDELIASGGNDTYIFTDSLIGFQFMNYNFVGLPGGIDVTINGIANTGSIVKNFDGTDTFTDIKTTLDSAFSGAGGTGGGFGLSGSEYNDTYNITNTVTLPSDTSGQWMFIRGNDGVDTYVINSGAVRLDFRGPQAVNVNLSTGTVANDGYGNAETITGDVWEIRSGDFNDVLVGSANDESFIGQLGSDNIDGGGGFDRLRFDRDGAEQVTVDLGAGTATGTWNGTGFTYTISNIEWVRGTRDGDDTLSGDGNINRLQGSGGDDALEGLGGADELDGGDGLDVASYANSGSAVMVDLSTGMGTGGDAQGDTLTDIENLLGSAFHDMLTGDSGDNHLTGGDGDDILNGGDGDDVLEGGTGSDTADYSDAGSNVRIFLADTNGQNTLGAGRDIHVGIENVTGSAFNDNLYGDGGDNVLEGGDGDDRIVAGDGNDILRGGAGDDILKGRGGDDMLFGDAGDDIMFADAGVDTLDGGADNDILYGGSSNDVLDGGTGDDRLRGNLNNDTLNGGEGIDLLFGGGQNDTLNGDAGNDNLRGENGNDILDGGSGDDVLFGNGLGNTGDADIFVFKTGNEIDRIRDWEDGTDMIDLTSYGFATAGDALAQFSQVGGSVRFIDGSDTLIIEGELLANITAADIMI